MKVSYITVLMISLSYGLERPLEKNIPSNKTSSAVDLSQVEPIPKIKQKNLQGKTNESAIKDSSAASPSKSQPFSEDTAHSNTPWLGVSGEAIGETLKTHLREESGLVLRVVAEGSPADLSGLSEHDVILSVDGRKITSQDSLRDVILSYQPEEKLEVAIISKGVKKNVPVALGSRVLNNKPGSPSKEKPVIEDPMSLDEEENALRATPRRGLGKMLNDMGLNKLLKEADLGNSFNLDFNATSTIKIHDSEGTVEVQTLNGEKRIIVKDKQAQVQYEGAWNTEEDKASAPPEIRKRAENVNFNYKQHKLNFGTRSKSEMR